MPKTLNHMERMMMWLLCSDRQAHVRSQAVGQESRPPSRRNRRNASTNQRVQATVMRGTQGGFVAEVYHRRAESSRTLARQLADIASHMIRMHVPQI